MPQAYMCVTSMDQVGIQSIDDSLGHREQIVIKSPSTNPGFTYYGNEYRKILRKVLCQGTESYRENYPQSVDLRKYSKDPVKREKAKDYFDHNTLGLEKPDKKIEEPALNEKGLEFETDENGVIETYFDVAYEVEDLNGEKFAEIGRAHV